MEEQLRLNDSIDDNTMSEVVYIITFWGLVRWIEIGDQVMRDSATAWKGGGRNLILPYTRNATWPISGLFVADRTDFRCFPNLDTNRQI